MLCPQTRRASRAHSAKAISSSVLDPRDGPDKADCQGKHRRQSPPFTTAPEKPGRATPQRTVLHRSSAETDSATVSPGPVAPVHGTFLARKVYHGVAPLDIQEAADRLHNLHNILIWADLQELASTWFRKTCTCAGSCALSPGDINRSAWSTHHRKHDPSIGAPVLQLKSR